MDTNPSETTGTATIGNSSIPATTAVHASMLHTIFADLEKLIGLAADPAVVALLPTKFQSYAGAAVLVEQVIAGAVSSASAPAASPAS